MKTNGWKILIVAALVAVVGVILATKHRPVAPAVPADASTQPRAAAPPQTAVEQPASPAEPAVPASETAVRTAAQTKPVTAPPAARSNTSGQNAAQSAKPDPPAPAAAPPAPEKRLPKLLDLGAKKCVPCKMMAPLLEELARDYQGRLDVEFIDVWENPGAAEQYGIQSIPTQIFYDADGKEFFRHVGFYPKEDILARFKEKGITF